MILYASLTKESFGQRILESNDNKFSSNSQKLSKTLLGRLDNLIYSKVNLNKSECEDFNSSDFIRKL